MLYIMYISWYTVNHIDSFEILVRKRIVERLKERLQNKLIVNCLDETWKIKFDLHCVLYSMFNFI